MSRKSVSSLFSILIWVTGLGGLVTACSKTYTWNPVAPQPTVTATFTPSPTFTPTPTIPPCPNGGVVTTLAGSSVPGSTNATGTAASFLVPTGVAADSSGNVYVADSANELIREITSGGVVTTLAGQTNIPGPTNGTGTGALFYYPTGVAVDTLGNVYVADKDNYMIRKITSGAVVTTLAGSGTPGSTNATGTAASFNSPIGVAVDTSGNVYVADTYNDLIRKITPGGVVTTLAGQTGVQGSTNATGTAASFYYPYAVAVDPSGNVYVADTGNNLIRKITSGGVVTTLAGSGALGSTNATGTAASFGSPNGIAVDASGTVYVADTYNNLIRKITPGGVVTTLAGSGSTFPVVNATGTAATFDNPWGITINSSCDIFVGDTFNYQIREIQ